MRIKVSEIPDEGLGVKLEVGPGELAEGGDLTAPGPAEAEFSLRRVGDGVYLTGRVKAALTLVCSRCSKDFQFNIDEGLAIELHPAGSLTSEDERELEAGELDVEFFEDDTVDLDELAREQVLLQLPMKPVCTEGCRGLCQYCGQDLNEGECACEEPTGHPGFAGLKELLKGKGDKEGAGKDG